ncbi:MAG: hypothetical protein WD040_02885 [Anaerolineales bacterium]
METRCYNAAVAAVPARSGHLAPDVILESILEYFRMPPASRRQELGLTRARQDAVDVFRDARDRALGLRRPA